MTKIDSDTGVAAQVTEPYRVLLFGNSGSGKSTLAQTLRQQLGLAHLDLDTLAWAAATPPERRPLVQSRTEIEAFSAAHSDWVIEGCYGDLIEMLLPQASVLVYLNVPVAQCRRNALQRPWEPHKYSSKAAQDANLAMLLDWIESYPRRQDVCSQSAHQVLFQQFRGKKWELIENASPEILVKAITGRPIDCA